MAEKRDLTPQEKKTANLLCILSLLCEVFAVGYFLFDGAIGFTHLRTDQITQAVVMVDRVLETFSGIALIAGIVILILVRVKYPANVFSKVLIWVYVIVTLLIIVAIVLLIMACFSACTKGAGDIWSCLQGCGRIG